MSEAIYRALAEDRGGTRDLIDRALAEDLGDGDLTSRAVVFQDVRRFLIEVLTPSFSSRATLTASGLI